MADFFWIDILSFTNFFLNENCFNFSLEFDVNKTKAFVISIIVKENCNRANAPEVR